MKSRLEQLKFIERQLITLSLWEYLPELILKELLEEKEEKEEEEEDEEKKYNCLGKNVAFYTFLLNL